MIEILHVDYYEYDTNQEGNGMHERVVKESMNTELYEKSCGCDNCFSCKSHGHLICVALDVIAIHIIDIKKYSVPNIPLESISLDCVSNWY